MGDNQDCKRQLPPIVKAKVEDIDALITFGKGAFTRTFGHLYTPENLKEYLDEAYTVQQYKEWVENDDYGVWIGWENDSTIGGYVLCSPCGLPLDPPVEHAGEIKRLYIAPNYFGTGLAALLMDVCMVWLKERYQNSIYLGVYSENFRAQKFYEKQGFKHFGEYSFQVGESFDREFIYKYEN